MTALRCEWPTLLRPFPYKEPDWLVKVCENRVTNGWSKVHIGAPVLDEWRRKSNRSSCFFERLAPCRAY